LLEREVLLLTALLPLQNALLKKLVDDKVLRPIIPAWNAYALHSFCSSTLQIQHMVLCKCIFYVVQIDPQELGGGGSMQETERTEKYPTGSALCCSAVI